MQELGSVLFVVVDIKLYFAIHIFLLIISHLHIGMFLLLAKKRTDYYICDSTDYLNDDIIKWFRKTL